MNASDRSIESASSRFRPSYLVWLGLYLAMLAFVVVGLIRFRRVALETMGTPEARAQWQAWREAPPNQAGDQPVRRRPPKSAEPPMLVLVRDHFAVVMTGAVLCSSLLFAALALAARGAFGKGSVQLPARSDG
jgi:hypothetical protein